MLFNLLLDATEAAEQTPEKTNPITYVIFGILLVAIIGLFVWQSISGKKKQKEAQNMLDSLKKGDRVKTIGGICGFVYEINNEENTFVLETGAEGHKSYVKLDKGAIYQTAPKEGAVVAAENAEKEAKAAEQAKSEEVKNETVEVVPEEKPAKKSKKAKKTEVTEEIAPVEEVKEEPKTEEVFE